MTRISKSAVHGALERAARNIAGAAGDDGRISRSEVKDKLKTLTGTEKKLTDIFFRFIDHRDHVAGAQVTGADIEKAVAYAKEKLIDRYDLDRNGLSAAEISKMSLTGKLAVELARELKKAGTVDVGASVPVPTGHDAAGYHYQASKVSGTYLMPGGAYRPDGPRGRMGFELSFNAPRGTAYHMSSSVSDVTTGYPARGTVTVLLDLASPDRIATDAISKRKVHPELPLPGIGNYHLIIKDKTTGAELYRGDINNIPRP